MPAKKKSKKKPTKLRRPKVPFYWTTNDKGKLISVKRPW